MRRVAPPMAVGAGGLSADDDADRAGVLGVLDLDREAAGAAVDACAMLPRHGGRVGERAAAVVRGRAGCVGRVGGERRRRRWYRRASTAGPKTRPPQRRSGRSTAGAVESARHGARCASSRRRRHAWRRCRPRPSSCRPLIRSTVSPQMSEYDSLSAPGLPLVDQAGVVLGVGVAPLVGDDVVGGDAVAVVRRARRSSWRSGS